MYHICIDIDHAFGLFCSQFEDDEDEDDEDEIDDDEENENYVDD